MWRKSAQGNKTLDNVSLIKDRIKEIEREVNEGLISEASKQETINELKLSILDEQQDTADAKVKSGRLSIILLLGLTLPAVLIGIGVYWNANQLDGVYQYNQGLVKAAQLADELSSPNDMQLSPNDYASLALSIRHKLRTSPNDVIGWSSLGQVNLAIGRIEQSIAAYRKALKIEPNNLNLRYNLANALTTSNNEDDLRDAIYQINYLIANSENKRNSYLMLTVVAIKLGEAQLAQNSFEVIKSQLDPNAPIYQSIVNELSALGVSAEADVSVENDIQLVASSNIQISVVIDIDGPIVDQIPENGFLIVFAQRLDGTSRAPLAVKRIPIPSFPVMMVLSDQDAMLEGMNLSSVEQVKITARISNDANVMPSSGELEGQVLNVNLESVKNDIVKIKIDRIVP